MSHSLIADCFWLWPLLILQDGYFRILRGSNECGIEEEVTGGLPKHHALAGISLESAASEVSMVHAQ